MVIPVTGERLAEVQAVGWGDGHEVLATNEYGNPFWNTTGFFKTSGGHSSRISVFWHVAAGEIERGSFYGNLMSYIMERPEGSPDTVMKISKEGKTVIDANGYPQGDVKIEAVQGAGALGCPSSVHAREDRARRVTHVSIARVHQLNPGGPLVHGECL